MHRYKLTKYLGKNEKNPQKWFIGKSITGSQMKKYTKINTVLCLFFLAKYFIHKYTGAHWYDYKKFKKVLVYDLIFPN